MCELFAMSSRYPATVRVSLEELARHGGLTAGNRDGWGIAYYDDHDVRVIREPEPAANSEWVRFIEAHDLRSTIVVSHIRHATQGVRALRNTQPFCRELGGRRHLFAHNGDLGDIARRNGYGVSRSRPIGETDSEHAFCLLLERMAPLWHDAGPPSLERRWGVFREFVADVRRLGPANVIYADGDAVYLHGDRRVHEPGSAPRPPGLHLLQRRCVEQTPYLDTDGISVHSRRDRQLVVLAASVPLSHEPWEALAAGEMVLLAGGEVVERATMPPVPVT